MSADRLVVQYSPLDADPEWDAFLESLDEGRHEQSSLWARAKSSTGWSVVRALVKQESKIVAGFQLLWRTGPMGRRLGYVSFGPVVAFNAGDAAASAVQELLREASVRKLDVLLIQPPPGAETVETALREQGCMANRIYSYITATAVLDLGTSEDALLGAMRATTRQNIRRAMKSDLIFCESGEHDLPGFYHLMEMTCRRQGLRPNPANETVLATIWKLYHPLGKMRLFVVKSGSEIVSAGLLLAFGARACIWKIGWSGRRRESKPNDLLHWGMIRQAKEEGYRLFDFCAIDPSVVAAANRNSVPKRLMKSPSFFKLGYGAAMVPYPTSLVFFRHGCVRALYRLIHPLFRSRG